MLIALKIGLIWIVINVINVANCYNIDAINAIDAIYRNHLNANTPLRSDMDHCNRMKEGRYRCLIGNSMLSREGEFYKMLVLKANPEKLVILSFKTNKSSGLKKEKRLATLK